jgi:hypothetical protein
MRSHSRGSSLIELVTTMVVAGVVLGSSLVGTGRLRDRWATEAARDAAIGLFFEARSRAMIQHDATGVRLFVQTSALPIVGLEASSPTCLPVLA